MIAQNTWRTIVRVTSNTSFAVAQKRALPTTTATRPTTTSSSSSSSSTKQRFACLDLRASNLSVIERLCLEECLLRHDDRQWLIWGIHHPTRARYLDISNLPEYISHANNNNNNSSNNNNTSDNCIVVMGIGGKPDLLLDVELVKQHGISVIKRFSGGGTVVVDQNCVYTTIIGRNDQLTEVPAYPREIMQWTAEAVFGPTFHDLKQRALLSKQQQDDDYPDFELKEHDYVLGGTQKVGGNAQSIVKTGWLHHTTFLWDYSQDNMKYLTLPKKRPDYRKDREHSNFLIKLKDAYQNQLEMDAFFQSMESVCQEQFDLESVSLEEVLTIMEGVVGTEAASKNPIQAWFESKGRTKVMDLP